jgi:hypothetical protein
MKGLVDMVTREPEKTVKPVIGHVFKKGRRTWEVSAVTKHFIIATATNAKRKNDEVIESKDIIMVKL